MNEQLNAQTSAQADILENNCELSFSHQTASKRYTLVPNKPIEYPLAKGKTLLSLSCNNSGNMVFSFEQALLKSLKIVSSESNTQRLAATHPLFLLPSTPHTTQFELDIHAQTSISFALMPLEQAHTTSLLHNLTMAAFYGLCLGLILYVFLMGQRISELSFQLYSLYVFCTATFFLLQEGQLNIFFPQQAFVFGHYLYTLFAAFTVLSATLFIVNITEIKSRWPKLTHFILYPMAACVMFIASILLITEQPFITQLLHYGMAYTTFAIMLLVLALVTLQTLKKVKMSWLVLLSLISMVIAMFIRIFPTDSDPFLQRYALIIAFAFEAFIFAIVVSSRIQLIKQGKLQAESDANTDSLCNVLNRRGWVQAATRLVAEQKQNGGLISLLYIDLDKFKTINDTYGHESGDKVLRIMTKIIRNQVRNEDLIGRVGGDEFVVIGLFETEYEPIQIAHRLKQRLALQSLQISNTDSIDIGASVGHIMSDEVDTITDILSQADQSMYTVKRDKSKLNLNLQT